MFEYFKDNYVWDCAVIFALEMGAVMSEVDAICSPLRSIAGSDTAKANDAWSSRWGAVGDQLESQAQRDLDEGHQITAAEKFIRAALYHLLAERVLPSRHEARSGHYTRGLELFARGIALRGDPAELVAVPYGNHELPGILYRAAGDSKSPCMIHFNGFDWIKEFSYLMLAEAYAKRGISSLFCDQPGTGGALRESGIPALPEMEKPAAACVDLLAAQTEIDPARIGIQGISMGGFYAPRAAAFEHRLACCVAWGAYFNSQGVAEYRAKLADDYEGSVPDIEDHMCWVMGKPTLAEAGAIWLQFDLADVASQIECPLLIVHGLGDRQVPADHGRKTYDAAINSARRDLVEFSVEEGGSEHCSLDNIPAVRGIMADWIAEVLGAEAPRTDV